MNLTDNLNVILGEMATDPRAAATRLEVMAAKLMGLAGKLREAADAPGGFISAGGMVDRVKTRVVGPGGEIKLETDTGA